MKFIKDLIWKSYCFWSRWSTPIVRAYGGLEKKIKVGRQVQIIGLSKFVIQNRFLIGDFSVITVNFRASKFGRVFSRGGCLGRNNFVSVGRRVFFGRHFFSSNGCTFICASHNFNDPLRPYQQSPVIGNAKIWIQDNVFFGANCLVVGDVTIGYGSFINAGSRIDFDVPPLSYVTGSPPRITKRFDWVLKKWVDSEAFKNETLPGYGIFKAHFKSADVRFNPYAFTGRAGWIW